MEKVLFKTKFDKDIVEGQQYYAVKEDGSVYQLVAEASQAKDKTIVEKFLTTTGANKLSQKILTKLNKKPKEKSQEELDQELEDQQIEAERARLAALNPLEQLDEVESEDDFKTWLERNNFETDYEGHHITIANGTGINFFQASWTIRGSFSCCGAREIGSHSSYFDQTATRFLTHERMLKLAQYLAPSFKAAIKSNGNYGYVTYLRDSGNFASGYGRMAYMIEALDCFTKTGTFNNPNGGKSLDIYAINDSFND